MASFTITNSASELVPENRHRKSIVIQNLDTTIAAFIKFELPGQTTVSATDHDHRLGPGSGIALDLQADGKEQVQGRITIIAASGTPRISYFETEDIKR